MADDKKKGIKGIDKTRKSSVIKSVESVEDVEKVQKTKGVSGVGKASAASGAQGGQPMSFEDREKLMNMVDEEAAKLFGKSKLPAKQKKLVQEAVKMAIDAALVPEEKEDKE